MRFRRKSQAGEDTTLCCPRCKELLPEGTLHCDMCGFDAQSEAQAECEPEQSASGREVTSTR